MRTKHLFVLIHIRNKGEVCTINLVLFLLTIPKVVLLLWILFVIHVSWLSCFLVCSLQPCGHLLGKSWPFRSLVCDVLSLSNVVSWVSCDT